MTLTADDGRCVVAWNAEGPTTPDPATAHYAQRFATGPADAAAVEDTAFQIGSASGTSAIMSPTVADDVDGDFVVGWARAPNPRAGSTTDTRLASFL